VIPRPRPAPLGALHERVRYENGRWPLWRWDRNARYVLKSLIHRATPWTDEDRAHHAAARAYLEGRTWAVRGPRALRVVMAGDLMWIRDGWRDVLAPPLCARIAAADLAICNLETPVVPGARVPRLVYETLHYNAPPAYLEPWRAARAAAVSLCNNHALDQGPSGLAATHATLRGLGLHPVGGPAAADAITAITVAGARIGVTAVTFGINHLAGAPPDGIPIHRFGDPGHRPDWARLAGLLAAARAAGPDLVVLIAHWGYEYEYWPDAAQRADALRLIELGADLIVGSSPHVLQPVELVSINGADPACPLQVQRNGPPRLAVIAWSLGNLATVMPTLPCRVGALLELDLSHDGNILSPSSLAAVPTFSRRGLGARWLDVATRPLADLPAGERARAAHHARTILGNSLVEGAT
jgi:hypothetical protein